MTQYENIEHSDIKIFAADLDNACLSQLNRILGLPPFRGERVRIMPDVHSGKSSIIGFTSTAHNNMFIPNIISGDIGCGVFAVKLKVGKRGLDFVKLDKVIQEKIPSGMGQLHDSVQFEPDFNISEVLYCWDELPGKHRLLNALGTLGSGNHFIEVAKDSKHPSDIYLVIHSGSRNLGTRVCEYYQELAAVRTQASDDYHDIPYDLCWIEGENAKNYLNDIDYVQRFAYLNRLIIAQQVCKGMKWKFDGAPIDTRHNYIEVETTDDYSVPIIRKGAVNADKDEELIIPLNMAYGSLICKGLGNQDWNWSAPHGAGRIMDRATAKDTITLSDYRKVMKEVWSSTIGKTTIDEAPQAYKDPDNIISLIENTTVEVQRYLVPVYNWKR